MIDTIRISNKCKIALKGWADSEIITRFKSGAEKVKMVTTGGENKTDPRLTYYPKDELLTAEVSLPKFLKNNNVELLDDDQLNQAKNKFITWIESLLGIKIVNPKVIRLDCCYAWETEDVNLYLKAFSGFPISGYTRSPYVQDDGKIQGFTWRCKTVKINAYDKGIEAKLDVNILRLEKQDLNNKAVLMTAARNDVDQNMDLISNQVSRNELRHFMARAGLTSKFSVKDDLFTKLVKEFGFEDGSKKYFFTELFKNYGVGMKNFMSPYKYFHQRKEMLKNGWLCQADKELPELKVK